MGFGGRVEGRWRNSSGMTVDKLHAGSHVRSVSRTTGIMAQMLLAHAFVVGLHTSIRMPRAPAMALASAEVEPMLSGLNGKALLVELEDVPSKAEVRAVVPDHCYTRQTGRSLGYLAQSLTGTTICTLLGLAALPLNLGLPFWFAYAAVTGTVAMGCWVLAHECGHGAFSDNRRLQDVVGFFLHSALLVPYFSWQREPLQDAPRQTESLRLVDVGTCTLTRVSRPSRALFIRFALGASRAHEPHLRGRDPRAHCGRWRAGPDVDWRRGPDGTQI